MSLATANLWEMVRKQFVFKLRANIDAFSSLIWIQLIAILFSVGGSSSSMTSSELFQIEVKYYSSDLVIVFTMIWAFVSAITITTKPYRYQDFTFVTNRISSNLSNMLFLLSVSMLGAITAILSKYLLQVIGYFVVNEQMYTTVTDSGTFFLGVAISFLYIFCISSIGYLIGALVQISKLFAVIIPVLIIGILFLEASLGRDATIVKIFEFYILEPSAFVFSLKILFTTTFFFLASLAIFNRMEVKR